MKEKTSCVCGWLLSRPQRDNSTITSLRKREVNWTDAVTAEIDGKAYISADHILEVLDHEIDYVRHQLGGKSDLNIYDKIRVSEKLTVLSDLYVDMVKHVKGMFKGKEDHPLSDRPR